MNRKTSNQEETTTQTYPAIGTFNSHKFPGAHIAHLNQAIETDLGTTEYVIDNIVLRESRHFYRSWIKTSKHNYYEFSCRLFDNLDSNGTLEIVSFWKFTSDMSEFRIATHFESVFGHTV